MKHKYLNKIHSRIGHGNVYIINKEDKHFRSLWNYYTSFPITHSKTNKRISWELKKINFFIENELMVILDKDDKMVRYVKVHYTHTQNVKIWSTVYTYWSLQDFTPTYHKDPNLTFNIMF